MGAHLGVDLEQPREWASGTFNRARMQQLQVGFVESYTVRP